MYDCKKISAPFIQLLCDNKHTSTLNHFLRCYKSLPLTLSLGVHPPQDMTARDLLQQRYTLPNGDTAWRPSPLVTAAIEGKLLLLDGIHRVNLGTLAVLSRYFSLLKIYSFHDLLAVLFLECTVDIIACIIFCILYCFFVVVCCCSVLICSTLKDLLWLLFQSEGSWCSQ